MGKTNPRSVRQERRRLENREAILHAAQAAILRKGISAVSMDDVAAEAQFSKATIYRYFRNKAELVSEILIHFIDDLDGQLQKTMKAPGSVRERLAEWIGCSLRFLAGNENLAKILLLDHSVMRLLQILVDDKHRDGSEKEMNLLRKILARHTDMNRRAEVLLREGVETGEFRPIEPRSGLRFLEAVIEGYFVQRFWTETKSTVEREIEHINDFVFRGLENRGSREKP